MGEGQNSLNLGKWCAEQRFNKSRLSEERFKRLDAVGFVWNHFDALWEQNFSALEAYMKEHGGQCPPRKYKHTMGEGQNSLNLGRWCADQRHRRSSLSDMAKALQMLRGLLSSVL